VSDINRWRLQRLERELMDMRRRLASVEERRVRAMIESRLLEDKLDQGLRELDALRAFVDRERRAGGGARASREYAARSAVRAPRSLRRKR
jgi:hypothetical protein